MGLTGVHKRTMRINMFEGYRGGRTPHRLARHNSADSTRLPAAGGTASPMRDAQHALYLAYLLLVLHCGRCISWLRLSLLHLILCMRLLPDMRLVCM